MPLVMEVGLGPGDIVLDGHQGFPLQKGGTALSQFSAHVYCGQTVAHLSYCWALVFTSMQHGWMPLSSA